MSHKKDNKLSGIVSHLFDKIPYSVKLLFAGSQIFINTYFLQPEKAQAQQQVLVIPVQQNYNSEFYPTSLEQAKAQFGEVKKGFPSTPVNIYISPDYDVVAHGIRAKIINAADRLNQNFPGLFAIVQDSTNNGINVSYKDDAFGEVQHFYNQDGNLVKTNVSHSNFDMVFDRLLIRSLGLNLSLDKNDISEAGILSETEKAIITTYLNLPNGTSMNIFESLVSDNIPPTTFLTAPDSVHIGQQITLDASGTADNNSQIRKYFWQIKTSYNPNSVFSPDTTTAIPTLTITPSATGIIRYAVVASDPTKNSSIATKEIKVKEQQAPQNYILTINALDVLLKDVVPDSAGVSNLEVLIRNSATDSLLASGLTDSRGKITLQIPAIQDSLLMIVRDEAIATTDSINGLGNYFDIHKKLPPLTLDYSDTTQIIPVIPIVSTIYKNLLNYIKFVSVTDLLQYTLLHRWPTLPIPIYLNKAGEDSILIDHVTQGLNMWKDKTGFIYNGYNLQSLNLWTDVSEALNDEWQGDYQATENTGYGINLFYEDSISRVDFGIWEGTTANKDLKPRLMRVNIKPDGGEVGHTIHEFSHVLGPMIGDGGREGRQRAPTYASSPGTDSIHPDDGKALRVIMSLPNFINMSIYKQD